MITRATPEKGIGAARAAAFAIVVAAALGLALFPVFPKQPQAQVGDTSSRTVAAPRDFSFLSESLTEKRRDEAAAAVPETVVFNSSVRLDQGSKLVAALSELSRLRTDQTLPLPAKSASLSRVPNLSLSQRGASLVFSLPEDRWQAASAEARRVISQVLSQSLAQDSVEQARNNVREQVDPSLGSDEVLLVEELVKPLIRANLEIDQARTQEARDAARAAVVPERVNFTRSQTIVGAGDVIDATALEAMKEAGLLSPRLDWHSGASVVAISLLSGVLLGLYVFLFQPRSVSSNRRLLLLLVMTAVPVLLAKLYLPLILPDDHRRFLAYMLPLAAAPMVVASLLESELAVAVASLMAGLVVFTAVYLPDLAGVEATTGLDALRLFGVYGFGAVAGVFAIHRAERLHRHLLAGLAIGVTAMLTLVATWLLDGDRAVDDMAWMAAAAGSNGALSAFVALGSVLGLSSLFGITTRLQLMELAQLNQPLLRRLQDEAPGTFHHSVIVGNMAERAADLIGADSLLVRVGCYYHDVGKLLQPGYYVENQMGEANPHDTLDPHVSAQIVAQHVHSGLELARRYRLPPRVQAFVPEHHGTRLVAYFYRKAAQQQRQVDLAPFTYPGPRPQSRETAIAMLADSAEAVARSDPDHSPEHIDALVDEVIAERVSEGQLDECDLTLRDLKTIAESFKATLRGVYHPRLEYPAPSAAERRARPLSLVRLPFRGPGEAQERRRGAGITRNP